MITSKISVDQGADTSGNKITLLNSNELTCYPKENPAESNTVEPTDLDFFLDHAFFFYNHADKILSDSRMFLAPVPVRSGIAYSGTHGFENPTLGIFLEWWLHSDCENTKDHQGNDALTYFISGSPLSGTNACSCVYPDGSTAKIHHYSFHPVWKDFMEINTRYELAKAKYKSYTLQEIFKILNA